jgi:U2 small nuclear ribonucleoprotein A'
MKLTPELLAQAPSALNPVKERQLDLRGKSTKIPYQDHSSFVVSVEFPGYKIPAIENLGVTKVRTLYVFTYATPQPTRNP